MYGCDIIESYVMLTLAISYLVFLLYQTIISDYSLYQGVGIKTLSFFTDTLYSFLQAWDNAQFC